MSGQALVVRGDALHLPLPDNSVDLVVTSPPYFSLRSYGAGPGEIGSEPTPQEFLRALWAATAEMARVLKPTGSIFVDLGDKYAGAPSGPRVLPHSRQGGEPSWLNRHPPKQGIRDKSLLLLPEAYRLGCTGMLAALGGPDPGLNLIARAVVCWAKVNSLPESVEDRPRRSHEDWVMLTKSPRYYSALDELREPYNPNTHAAGPDGALWRDGITAPTWGKNGSQSIPTGVSRTPPNPLGKLPGSVWSIPSEPLDLPGYLVRLPGQVTMMDAGPLWRHVEWMRRTGQPGPVLVKELDHYAAFPSEWPRRLIRGFSPPGICLACGQGRFPVVDRQAKPHWKGGNTGHDGIGRGDLNGMSYGATDKERFNYEATILGYACACCPSTLHPERRRPGFIPDPGDKTAGASANGAERNRAYRESLKNPPPPVREYHLAGWTPPPTRPSVVLDPFAGSGTTPLVAKALGRTGVGVELSHDYALAARWRVAHSTAAAKTTARTNRDLQGVLL